MVAHADAIVSELPVAIGPRNLDSTVVEHVGVHKSMREQNQWARVPAKRFVTIHVKAKKHRIATTIPDHR